MKKQNPPPNHPNQNYNPPEQPVRTFKRKPAANPITILGLQGSRPHTTDDPVDDKPAESPQA